MGDFFANNSEYIITAGAIIFLVLISGLFSGSETALTAVSKAKIKQLQKKKHKRANSVAKLLETPEKLIGSILLGNNLVNILASAIATSFFINLFGATGVVYATLIMTFMILVFAEVLPKTYALQNPEKLALFIAPVITFFVLISTPFVTIIRLIVKASLFILNVKPPQEMDEKAADDEIRGNIDLQHEEGVMIKNNRDMLGGILDLKQMGIDDVMIHRTKVFSLSSKLDVREIANKILDSGYTRVPLYKDNPDEFIGILHTKDLLRAINNPHSKDTKIDIESLLNPIWYVPETTSLQDQLTNFLKQKRHFALVVDEYGETQGIITLEDILEEIVGDIVDEHDRSIEGLRSLPNGSVNIDGYVSVRDLNREMDWQLPQNDAISVAGLIINEAQIIPDIGQAFNYFGYRFEILRKDKNRLTSIRVTPL